MYVPVLTPALRRQHEDYLRTRRHINAGATRFRAKTAIEVTPWRTTNPLERRRVIEELSGLLEPVFLLLIVEPEKTLKIETIQRVVAGYYKKSLTDICSTTRKHAILRPRYVGMYLARKFTRHSYPEIGRRYGGKDHTVVLYGVRSIARLVGDPSISQPPDTPAVAVDKELCEQIAVLKQMFGV